MDNCVRDVSNGIVRRECILQHWFASLAEEAVVLKALQDDYNNLRPIPRLGFNRRPSIDGLASLNTALSRDNFLVRLEGLRGGNARGNSGRKPPARLSP